MLVFKPLSSKRTPKKNPTGSLRTAGINTLM